MNLPDKVASAIESMDLSTGSILTQIGFPGVDKNNPTTPDKLELTSWIYQDVLQIPLQPLSDINIDVQLGLSEQQGAARNLKFPFPADVGFVFDTVTVYADIGFQNEGLTVETTPYVGSLLATAANRLLQAIKMTSTVSQKNYLNNNLAGFANYELPAVTPLIKGQAAGAPFIAFPPTYQNHHRINLPLSPEVVWPASSTVEIFIRANIKNWWSQLVNGTNEVVDFTKAPWTFPISCTLYFDFIGLQVRKLK